MARAISYIRFSSIQQGSGDSLRRQLELTHAYCQKNNLTLDETLSFRDLGVSGFHLQNIKTGAFGLLLDAIKAGRIVPGDYILVENLDRISRANVLDAFGIFSSILQNGITIVTLSDGKVYTKDSCNDIGNIILSILTMVRAYEESTMKSQRVAEAWANKRTKAAAGVKYTKKCPAWLRLIDNQFHVIQDRADLIRRIFDLSISGCGARVIAINFNEECIDTWGDGIHQSRKSDGWHFSYIKKILRSPATYGALVPGKMNGDKRELLDPISNYYTAVITHDTFLQAQAAIESRTHKGGRPGTNINIFQTLLKCSVCKGSIVRLNRGPRSRAVFACDKGRRGVSDCKYKPWVVEDVERAVLKHLNELDLDSILARVDTKLTSIRGSISAISQDIQTKQTQASRLVNLLAQGAANSPTLVSHLISLESEIAQLKDRLEALNMEEKEELDSVSSAKVAKDDVLNLMVTDDRDMRIRLQSSIRHLVSSIKLNLWAKKIVIYYRSKEPNGDFMSKVIMQSGRSVMFSHEL